MHLLIAAAAALPPAVSPTPIPLTTIPPAPIVVTSKTPVKTLTFAVTIRHGDIKLWEGQLAMASNGNASFNQRRDQTVACLNPRGRDRVGRFSTGFSLSLYGAYTGEGYSSVHISARLDRPATDGPLSSLCTDQVEQSVRSVEVQSTFAPADGKAVTIEGDAGFSVTLTPRYEAD